MLTTAIKFLLKKKMGMEKSMEVRLRTLRKSVLEAAQLELDDEIDLDDAPDEFLDPIGCDLMCARSSLCVLASRVCCYLRGAAISPSQCVRLFCVEKPCACCGHTCYFFRSDPVKLPSGHVMDRPVIQRIILDSGINPINRDPLTVRVHGVHAHRTSCAALSVRMRS
ncbi:hypothetical protein OAN61_00645 [bacterium]|nr:hypothetical protein [bacterium]